MDEVWCSLDMAADDIGAGIQQQPAAPDLHDPSFWPAFADGAASFIAVGDNACFGDLMDEDASGFLRGEADHLMLSSTSSLSSRRSLSIDSGGSMSSFSLDVASASAGATAANVILPHPQYPAAAPVAHGLFAGAGGSGDHDDAFMRAMMAVISSSSAASPSSSGSASASSPTPFGPDSVPQPAGPDIAPPPHQTRVGNGGHVMVKSSRLAVPPEKDDGAGRGGQQQAAACGNSTQLYHMMSERKRREKLNDSFHTLRSLLPPCSKVNYTQIFQDSLTSSSTNFFLSNFYEIFTSFIK
ncbi:hypothetical protein GUJ93_ZPchr0001g30684 [Zizania palustris]|uniref:BHLH domain-containing protein n=1 Tax=Zizania palustris TaxID=103762 RepID=A0A8J5S834_ZIZPA|nr:hypothetical protein GUJ93_ZPchr0001g30684 [Zizania palustris]